MELTSSRDIRKNADFFESKLQSFDGFGIYTRVINGIRVHGLICGWAKVKRTHYQSGLNPFFALFDPTWTDWKPIFCWVIEHPEGTIVIDTGETFSANADYIENTQITGWVNRQITKFSIPEKCEVGAQLQLLGIQPGDVRWVVLTHLHIDHTGGLKYFPHAEIIVSHQEFIKPYGAVEQTHPSWFHPHLVGYFDDGDSCFEDVCNLTDARDVIIVPTPGHTFGHQSVVLRTPGLNLFFAGDASFSFEQMRYEVVHRIHVDRRTARATLARIREYSLDNPITYLPSHDLKSVANFFGSPTDANQYLGNSQTANH
jgi:N-acyl homoserine lactone hydrolase